MKKITFLFMMLLSITAFSQIEIVENFDSTPNNQVPTGWSNTGNLRASTSLACSGKSVYTAIPAAATPASASITTPNYTAFSNGTDITVSFTLNVFEQFSQFPPPQYFPPATGWGSVVFEYSTNGGTDWTTGTTVDDSNFTYISTTNCVDVGPINIGAIANGSDFQARIVVNAVTVTNFGLIFVLDNISITQVATLVPNCSATLINPINGSSTADLDTTLMWQPATGLPTGYKVSVGTTTGGTDILNAATTTNTNYPLAGLGLAYETEYFVNIVPYNGIGDANTGCIEESFTTRSAPLTGATCGSPIVIDINALSPSTPYVTVNNTDLFEDNIDVSPCSNSYMSGKDVFYSITPTVDMSINVELLNVDNSGASIHVVNGCPDVATECLAYVGVYSATAVRRLDNVVLTAGNTYFIVLSNSGNTRTYNYVLNVEQNSCINPTIGSLTTVPNCANGQFSVDVDVSYLGSASTLTLTDNFGHSNNTISSTGLVNMGPYPSGSIVDFTLTNNQDNSCSNTGSTYFYCPPSNDDCGAAIALSVNTDDTCTLFTSATNAGATDSTGDPAACTGNTNDVWFSFIANGSTMIVNFLNVVSAPGTPSGAIVQSVELLEGNCGALTSLGCYSGGTSGYVEFSNLTDGNTYYIRDKSNSTGEYAQNYDICLKTAPTPPANDEVCNAIALTLSDDDQCGNQSTGTTIGATLSAENACDTSGYRDVWYVFSPATTGLYEFKYETLITTPSSGYVVYEGTCGALTQKSGSCSSTSNQIFTLNSGTNYYVMVKSSTSGPGIDFNLCVWQLPPAAVNNDCSAPTTLLESSDLNGNNTISGNLDNSYPSPESCSSSYNTIWYSFTPQYTGTYNFDFTRVDLDAENPSTAYYTVFNTDDCASTSGNYVTGFSCYTSADKTGDLVAGNTYLIAVLANASASVTTFDLFVYPDPSLSIADTNFELFKYYPNPVNNTLTLEARNTISNVSIYNIVGQKVQSIAPNNMEANIDMSELNQGVYFLTVTINNSQKTFRIIKN